MTETVCSFAFDRLWPSQQKRDHWRKLCRSMAVSRLYKDTYKGQWDGCSPHKGKHTILQQDFEANLTMLALSKDWGIFRRQSCQRFLAPHGSAPYWPWPPGWHSTRSSCFPRGFALAWPTVFTSVGLPPRLLAVMATLKVWAKFLTRLSPEAFPMICLMFRHQLSCTSCPGLQSFGLS